MLSQEQRQIRDWIQVSINKSHSSNQTHNTTMTKQSTTKACSYFKGYTVSCFFFCSFSFEPSDSCPKDVCDLFTVVPNHGTLGPVDRPQQVQVIFKSNREVTVRDQPILRCQVIEPSMNESGETIASIPIKVSVRSVFSK